MSLVDKARAAAPTLAATDAASSEQGRLTEEAVAALRATGVLRALQPRRWGGGEVSPAEYAVNGSRSESSSTEPT